MMLAWSFFDLQVVINALIVTRILEQFVAQAIGVMIWRRARPERRGRIACGSTRCRACSRWSVGCISTLRAAGSTLASAPRRWRRDLSYLRSGPCDFDSLSLTPIPSPAKPGEGRPTCSPLPALRERGWG